MNREHNGGLAVLSLLTFAAIYVLMYAKVDKLQHVYWNVNQAYMVIVGPMIIVEDQELTELCKGIVSSQRAVSHMRAKLATLAG